MQSCATGSTCLTKFIRQTWTTEQIHYSCIPMIWWWIGAIALFPEHFDSYIYQNDLLSSLALSLYLISPFTFSLSLVFLSEFFPSFLCQKFHLKSHYCSHLAVGIRLWMFNTEWQWSSASSTNCTNHYFKDTTGAECLGLTQKMVNVLTISWLDSCKRWMLKPIFKVSPFDPEHCSKVTRHHVSVSLITFIFFTLLPCSL